MKRICLVIPYFGKFPNYFRLWLESAKHNKDIDFLIVTDNEYKYEKLPNVHIQQMTFDELKNRIQELYNFKIKIKKPYKLCDFRPAYGDIFKSELESYDFWGYCDIDLIFGNIKAFVTDEILEMYDKINLHGHFSLFRNNEKLRTLYRSDFKDLVNYTSVFSQDWSYHFDEYPGISYFVEYANIKHIDIQEYADINRFIFKFVKVYDRSSKEDDSENIKQMFHWKEGTLTNIIKEGDKITKKELMYVHLQKRNMEDYVNEISEGFFVIPNRFIQVPYDEGVALIDEYSKDKEYDELKKFKKQCMKQKFSFTYWKMKRVMFNKRWRA